MSKFWVVLGSAVILLVGLGCADASAITPTRTAVSTSTKQVATPLASLPTATQTPNPTATPTKQPNTATPIILLNTPTPLSVETAVPPTPTPTFAAYGITQTIGLSTQGLPIVSHQFGFGIQKVVLVGGMHGGYEWNTILLSYQLIDYFTEYPEAIPNDITLLIIPSANPDGQLLITQKMGRFTVEDIPESTAAGRFNGNGVDLNRNWGCDWAEVGYWREQIVDTGERPFSEVESHALSRYLVGQGADAVIFYHSAANGVFLGGCPEPLLETERLGAVYADAAQYPTFQSFSSYPVTGDASDWLTSQGIPSFSVELKNHTDTEYEQNLAGVIAILGHLADR